MTAAVVLVHGTAGGVTGDRLAACIDGCKRAAEAGSKFLGEGALAAVVVAVKVLEEDPSFNAGLGSTLTRDGTVELDAAIMTGEMRFGAVGACPPVASAIELALEVMNDGEHALLVGEGAVAFARERGVKILGPRDLIVDRVTLQLEEEKRRREAGGIPAAGGAGGVAAPNPYDLGAPEAANPPNQMGTVGAVALDVEGRLAAATSTGGMLHKRVGRIGDSPIAGAGVFADAEKGAAASATGHGEPIIKLGLCREAVDRFASGMQVSDAAESSLRELERRLDGRAGLIIVGRNGEIYAGRNTSSMPWASCVLGQSPKAGS